MIKVGLIGLPNVGKSALFNVLTGSRQRVANFPGVTVEQKKGVYKGDAGEMLIIDLPGLYTLDAVSLDEKIARDYILGKSPESIDKLILVVDATNLKKSLYLALQMKEINQDFVIALNMVDIADKRGLELDIKKFEELVGTKVVPISATKKSGIDELTSIVREKKESVASLEIPASYQRKIKDTEYIKEKLSSAEAILKQITVSHLKPDTFSEKLDSIVLHPIWGLWILLGVLILLFQALFSWSEPFIELIEIIFEFLATTVQGLLPDGILKDLIVDGIIAGIGSFMVFLPHIMLLFAIIIFLEDFGYLGRAAFMLDYLMRKVGLPGKAVVPLLSSHACAIPGIMSARIIKDDKLRLLTMMISPLTTCSARLPVYALLIAAIVPDHKVIGFIGLPGLILFGLYFMGIASAFIVSFLTKKYIFNSAPVNILMELPPYKLPSFFDITIGVLNRAKIFVKKAGTVILVLSVVLWALVSFPKNEAGKVNVENSYAAMIGKTIQPVFAPLGYDWRITTTLIPTFGAREVMVSALGTVLAVDGDEDDEAFSIDLKEKLSNEFSLATLISLIIWFVFAPQCISTFAILKRETGGWKWPLVMGGYTLGFAYFFAFVAYRVTIFLQQ